VADCTYEGPRIIEWKFLHADKRTSNLVRGRKRLGQLILVVDARERMTFLTNQDITLQVKGLITNSRDAAIKDAYGKIDIVVQKGALEILLSEYFKQNPGAIVLLALESRNCLSQRA
jgi:hypothetical protein